MDLSALKDLLALNGYGLYVWPAYAATLAGLLAEPWLIRRRMARARALAAEPWHATRVGHDGASAWSSTRPSGEAP